MYDLYEGLLSKAEEALKFTGLQSGVKYKGSALAGYFLNLGDVPVARREATIRDIITSYTGETPTDGIISTLSELAATWHTTTTQAPVYSSPTSTGLPQFIDPTYAYAPQPTPTPAPPEEEPSKKKKEKKPEDQTPNPKEESLTSSESTDSQVVTQNLDTTVMSHLKQVTGLSEETLLPIATTITTVKMSQPNISAEELEALIEDQVLVLEAKGIKVGSLNNPKNTPTPPSYTWDQVDEKIADSLATSEKYSRRSPTQIRQMVTTTRKNIEAEIDKFASESEIGIRQKNRLESNIQRDIVDYFNTTYPGLSSEERESLLDMGLKNVLLYKAAGEQRLKREASEPSTLARQLGNFNLNATGEELVIQTIHARAMAAGLDIDQARQFTQQVFPMLKSSYYFTGQHFKGLDPKKPTPQQKEMFLSLNRNLEAILASKSPESYRVPKNFNIDGFNLDYVHTAFTVGYGKPENMSPIPETYTMAQYMEAVQANLVTSLDPRIKKLASVVIDSPLGKRLVAERPSLEGLSRMLASGSHQGPVQNVSGLMSYLQGGYKLHPEHHFTQMVNRGQNTPVYQIGKLAGKGLQRLGSKAWSKFVTTQVGKQVAAGLAKFAAKKVVSSALAAIGSALPGIGTAIGYVLGEVATWLFDKTIGAAKKFLDGILKELGLSTDDLMKAGIAGLGVGLAFGSLGLGLAVAGSMLLGLALITLILAAVFLPIIVAVLGVPLMLAFFLFIINSGALIVPPSNQTLVSGPGGPGGGGFENRSGCPLLNGRIVNLSYNPINENQRGSHGTNYYWTNVIGANCTFSLPQSTGCRAPNSGTSGNVCYSLYPSNRCDYFGYAIDVFSPLGGSVAAPVSFPLINGEVTTWTWDPSPAGNFSNGVAGYTHSFRTTTTSGDQWLLKFTHIKQIANPAVLNGSMSGSQLGELFIQTYACDSNGDGVKNESCYNTHLHLEASLNDEWVKPENYFCGAGGGAEPPAALPPGTKKVMFLGDSLTVGDYPFYLKNLLVGKSVVYVGGTGNNPQREAHCGFSIGMTLNGFTGNICGQDVSVPAVSTAANLYKPDLVVLMLGTNGVTNSNNMSGIQGIINSFVSANPSVKFVLTKIPPFIDYTGTNRTTDAANFNNQLQSTFSSNPNVIAIVDQFTGFNISTDPCPPQNGDTVCDHIHPNNLGAQKIANKFYTTLNSILP